MSNSPTVTLVVVPRERFSYSESSLDSIYKNTRYPFELVYIDGNSPPKIRDYIENQANQRDFRLIRRETYLSPNAARNIGVKEVDSKYIVFIDNDVLVKPGWLKAMVDCAEESGAWAVGPLCLQGEDFKTIHTATGQFEFKQKGEKQWLIERRPFMRTPLAKLKSPLTREETQLIEFHCLLTRSEAFRQLGPLDEKLLSMAEESDFCLKILDSKNTIFFEPNAIISYIPPSKLKRGDKEYFNLRWSDDWCERSVEHFHQKWNLTDDSLALAHFRYFVMGHRNSIAKRNTHRVKSLYARVKRRLEKLSIMSS